MKHLRELFEFGSSNNQIQKATLALVRSGFSDSTTNPSHYNLCDYWDMGAGGVRLGVYHHGNWKSELGLVFEEAAFQVLGYQATASVRFGELIEPLQVLWEQQRYQELYQQLVTIFANVKEDQEACYVVFGEANARLAAQHILEAAELHLLPLTEQPVTPVVSASDGTMTEEPLQSLIQLAQSFNGIAGEVVVDWQTAQAKFTNTYQVFQLYRLIAEKYFGVHTGYVELNEHLMKLLVIFQEQLGMEEEVIDPEAVYQRLEWLRQGIQLEQQNMAELVSLAQDFVGIDGEVNDYESAKRKLVNTYGVFEEYRRVASEAFGEDFGGWSGLSQLLSSLKEVLHTELEIEGEYLNPETVRQQLQALKKRHLCYR